MTEFDFRLDDIPVSSAGYAGVPPGLTYEQLVEALCEISMNASLGDDSGTMSCGGIKMYDHRDCAACSKVVPVQTCPFCQGERSCMYCYGCPDCP